MLASAEGEASHYMAIGSFADHAKAERLAGRFANLKATVVPVTVAGKPYNRVVIGPVTESAALAANKRQPRDQKFADSWVLIDPPAPSHGEPLTPSPPPTHPQLYALR
jgi:cell division protein FtsN